VPGEPVERLSARVSPEAKKAWLAFCEAHGVTFTAMVEASGLLLSERGGRMLEDNATAVDLARKITTERFKRR
jgi:hypothetical protein